MDSYKVIIKERLSILPEKLRYFIVEQNWIPIVEKICRQHNLDNEKSAAVEKEILMVLLCFEPPRDLASNIKNEIGLDDNTSRAISNAANGSIFGYVMNEIKEFGNKIQQENTIKTDRQSNVGSEFESMILNQAKGMRPAGNPPSNLPTSSQPISRQPQRSPVAPQQTQRPLEPKQYQEHPKVPDYRPGGDPYREPIE